MEQSSSWENVRHAARFYGTQRFITVFTRAFHWSSFWARSILSLSPHSLTLRTIFILSTQLRLSLPSVLFPFGFPTNILYTFLFPHSRYIPCPPYPPCLDRSNYAWRKVFSIILSFHLYSVPVLSSAPCSQILSVYVPPLISKLLISVFLVTKLCQSCRVS
jgi:hypothetical protein